MPPAGPVVDQQQNAGEALHHKEEERNSAPVVPEGLRMSGNCLVTRERGKSEIPRRSSIQS